MVSSKHSESVADSQPNASIGQKATATKPSSQVELTMTLELEDCREEIRRLQAALKQLRSENLEFNRAMDRNEIPTDLIVLIESQARYLDLMHASLSWRITAPLRLLARLFGAD